MAAGRAVLDRRPAPAPRAQAGIAAGVLPLSAPRAGAAASGLRISAAIPLAGGPACRIARAIGLTPLLSANLANGRLRGGRRLAATCINALGLAFGDLSPVAPALGGAGRLRVPARLAGNAKPGVAGAPGDAPPETLAHGRPQDICRPSWHPRVGIGARTADARPASGRRDVQRRKLVSPAVCDRRESQRPANPQAADRPGCAGPCR